MTVQSMWFFASLLRRFSLPIVLVATTVLQSQTREITLPPFAAPSSNATTNQPKSITVDDVIKLSKAGLSDDVIITQIRKHPKPFDLSSDQLIQLKTAHVSDRVIQAMIDPTKDNPASSAQTMNAPVAPVQASVKPPQPSVALGQWPQVDHLSTTEIASAIAAKAGSGFVFIQDMDFGITCSAQYPSEAIFTPAGWIKARSENAKGQYFKFQPNDEDTMRVLTILSRGCANGTTAGPTCTTISRVALLSDTAGSVVVEAISTKTLGESWQNGYGASAACSALVSRFTLSDVQKVRNGKGEFLIATFNGEQLLKIYTVKEKHLKKLELQDNTTTSLANDIPQPLPAEEVKQISANSEAAKNSPAAAASLARTGHTYSPQEMAELVERGQASRCAVVTTPADAEILIDDNKMGVSPIAFVLLRHGDAARKITIRKVGYKTVEKEVVPDGKPIPVDVTLERQ